MSPQYLLNGSKRTGFFFNFGVTQKNGVIMSSKFLYWSKEYFSKMSQKNLLPVIKKIRCNNQSWLPARKLSHFVKFWNTRNDFMAP